MHNVCDGKTRSWNPCRAEVGESRVAASAYNLLTQAGEPYPAAELPLTRAVLHDEIVMDEIWKIQQPSGNIVEVEGSAVPVFDKNGAKIGAVLTIRRARGTR